MTSTTAVVEPLTINQNGSSTGGLNPARRVSGTSIIFSCLLVRLRYSDFCFRHWMIFIVTVLVGYSVGYSVVYEAMYCLIMLECFTVSLLIMFVRFLLLVVPCHYGFTMFVYVRCRLFLVHMNSRCILLVFSIDFLTLESDICFACFIFSHFGVFVFSDSTPKFIYLVIYLLKGGTEDVLSKWGA